MSRDSAAEPTIAFGTAVVDDGVPEAVRWADRHVVQPAAASAHMTACTYSLLIRTVTTSSSRTSLAEPMRQPTMRASNSSKLMTVPTDTG